MIFITSFLTNFTRFICYDCNIWGSLITFCHTQSWTCIRQKSKIISLCLIVWISCSILCAIGNQKSIFESFVMKNHYRKDRHLGEYCGPEVNKVLGIIIDVWNQNLEDQEDIPLRLQTLHTTFGQSDLSARRDQRKYLLKALFATNSEQKCQNSKL